MYWDQKNTIIQIKSILENDELLIVSTDTIIGFLGRITRKSFNKINDIKQRLPDKNYLIVSKNIDRAMKFIHAESLSTKVLSMLSICWPGAVTVIVQANKFLPEYVQSKDGTIAIRCPAHNGLQQLLEYFDGLFSTSANISGKPIHLTIEDISYDVMQQVAGFVIDDKVLEKVVPSTIIDVSQEHKTGTIKVIRSGAFSIEVLERLYGSRFSY